MGLGIGIGIGIGNWDWGLNWDWNCDWGLDLDWDWDWDILGEPEGNADGGMQFLKCILMAPIPQDPARLWKTRKEGRKVIPKWENQDWEGQRSSKYGEIQSGKDRNIPKIGKSRVERTKMGKSTVGRTEM